MQAKASFHVDGTGFGTSTVSLSLDDDHHLRVYKQSDQANQVLTLEPVVDIAATDVTRVYASLSKILIKTTTRWYVFDLSGNAADVAGLSSAIADVALPGMGGYYFIRLKGILAKLPMDEWLDSLQQEQFPVRRSGFNEFYTKKVLPHLFISFIIGLILGVALILIVCIVVFNGPGWLQDLRYFLFPQ